MLVDFPARYGTTLDDLVAGLTARKDLTEEERRDAIAYARLLGENPSYLNSEALRTARRSDATPEEYAHALRRIEAARRAWPVEDLNFLKTEAMAQYRMGNARAALETLDRSDTLLAKRAEAPRAVEVAVRAMAQHALHRTGEARRTLERLRTIMQDPPEAGDVEAQAFLTEAEAVVSRR